MADIYFGVAYTQNKAVVIISLRHIRGVLSEIVLGDDIATVLGHVVKDNFMNVSELGQASFCRASCQISDIIPSDQAEEDVEQMLYESFQRLYGSKIAGYSPIKNDFIQTSRFIRQTLQWSAEADDLNLEALTLSSQ